MRSLKNEPLPAEVPMFIALQAGIVALVSVAPTCNPLTKKATLFKAYPIAIFATPVTTDAVAIDACTTPDVITLAVKRELLSDVKT